MSETSDRWLKRIWLVNGLVILPLLLFAGASLLWTAGSGWWGGPGGITAQEPVRQDSTAVRPRAVRLGTPQAIAGTGAMLIAVQHGRGNYPTGSYAFSGDSYGVNGGRYGEGPVVNMMVLSPGGDGRLVFDRRAVIASWDRPEPDNEKDVGQSWIAYRAVLVDTNGNGRLDEEDRHDLYLTSLDGSGLRRVLTDSYSVRSYQRLRDPERLLVYAIRHAEDLAEEDRPLHAFLVDPGTGSAEPYDQVNQLVEQAGRIVGK